MTEKEINGMMTMQEEAKRRVMDMANRSRFAAEDMNRALFPKKEDNALQNKRQEPQKAPAAGGLEFNNMSREELERMFILSLCLLLSHEDADDSVILGLMYLLT